CATQISGFADADAPARCDLDPMAASLAVVWQNGELEPPAVGRIELLPDRLHLEGARRVWGANIRVAPRSGRSEALDVVPKHVGSSGPPWRLSAVEGSSVPRRTPD